ncbi:1,2-dihydroxy-3-keto-5-methylthiopentene dioxygenase [Candidatus Nitrospira bockiana]
MATLRVPDHRLFLSDEADIRAFLDERGVFYQRWAPDSSLGLDADDAAVLASVEHWLRPFMAKGGYRTADVVAVTPETPNLTVIRDKFLREHTHSEDEVRYFVSGRGVFWFHRERPRDEVFAVTCTAGDLLSVPANTKHWFDLGPEPHVRAIRIFTDQAGWVPHYTDSGIEQRYRE